MIVLDGIEKKYADKKVISDLSFQIETGDMIGVIGPNGSGKSTLFKMLTGLVQPTGGEISIDGMKMKNDHAELLSEIGAMIEYPAFYGNLTGRQNLKLEFESARLTDKEWLQRLIQMFDMEGYIDQPVKQYSLGMKQRLGLCRAMLRKPHYIILDEPTNGLDVEGTLWFWWAVHTLHEELKATVLVSGHSISELEKEMNHFLFLKKGEMAGFFHKEDLKDIYLCKTKASLKEKLELMEGVIILDTMSNGDLLVRVPNGQNAGKEILYSNEVIVKRPWKLLDEYMLRVHDKEGLMRGSWEI